jgi:DNA-binding NarL/FixJ family response regulator
MITITIASRHRHEREAMLAMLSGHDDFKIVGIGRDGYDALMSARRIRPDIIIMDFYMDGVDSSVLAPVIRRNSPSTGIIALCARAEHGSLCRAVRSGISGYLSIKEGFGDLPSSVRSVYHGGLYINRPEKDGEETWLEIYAKIPEEKGRLLLPTLTELGILSGIALGRQDRDIALGLNISVGTLRNYVSRMKKKTGFRNRTQVIIYALHKGIMRLEINDILKDTVMDNP